ncbi:hypothetical protein AeRB84_005603, partial [Aphanomyces euteiches]
MSKIRPQKHPKVCKTALNVLAWLVRISIEVFAYLIVPYWTYLGITPLVTNLISPTYGVMTTYDAGPTMAEWDLSLYGGFNTTAHENELLLRDLVDAIDTLPKGSQLRVAVERIPFLLTMAQKAVCLQGVTKTNQTADTHSSRYTLLIGKKFKISDPVFDPVESLVLYVRVDNRVHGHTALRVLQTVNVSDTHETLVNVSHVYPDLLGSTRFVICTTNYDAGTNRCGIIVLSQETAASLLVDGVKTTGRPDTPPSCMHPMMPSVIYSIMDIKDKSFHCAVDPNSIVDRYAFENMLTVSRIPTVPNQMLYSAGANLPTGFRLPLRDKGILDDTPNATVTMVPFMQGTNFVWIGQTSRIDFIIQTQMAILLVSRVATTVVYFLLLVKFSWTTGRSCFLVLVEYMSLK